MFKTSEEERAKKREYMREYNRLNRDKITASRRARRAASPEARVKESEAGKAWRAKNADHVKEQARREYLRKKVSGERRDYQLRKLYGITLERYNEMLVAQGGGCAICGGGPSGKSTDWLHVDHDHTTGAVRGLLCQHCNHGLGKFSDSPERLEAAAAYLRSKVN